MTTLATPQRRGRAKPETPKETKSGLTREAEKPPTGIAGLHFTYNRNPNGRPPNLPAIADACNAHDLGAIELATGTLTRYGMRLIVAASVEAFGIAKTAALLGLTRSLVRELLSEYFHPIPPLPRRHRPRPYNAKPLETEAERTAPILTRAKRLWHRGLDDGKIALTTRRKFTSPN